MTETRLEQFGYASIPFSGAREIVARTVESERAYYLELWSRLVVRADWVARVDRIIDTVMLPNRTRYAEAGVAGGDTPWWVVAIVHMMEGSGNFATHLHNGDPLSARTVQVPPGRPPTGEPPFTWEESAADALTLDGVAEQEDWSVAGAAYAFERFNGWGYRGRGIVSPYLAAQTNLWTKGKYVADGHFDPDAGSSQVGALAYLKRLADRGLIALPGSEPASGAATGPVTWFEFFRNAEGLPVVVGNAGATAMESVVTRDVDALVAFLEKHPQAKTFLVAPAGKPIPTPSPVATDVRTRVATFARAEASKGRVFTPTQYSKELDTLVLDPIRPELVRLGQLGASQADTFFDWCACWVTYVLRTSQVRVPTIPTVKGRPFWATVALVETWVEWAKDRGAWREGVSGLIHPGDVVVFDWDGDHFSNHIGIVLEPPAANKNMVTAEGNRGGREVITARTRDVVLGTIDLSKLV